MTEREESDLLESTRTVLGVVNDSVAGHARHAASLMTRAADPNGVIDPHARTWTALEPNHTRRCPLLCGSRDDAEGDVMD